MKTRHVLVAFTAASLAVSSAVFAAQAVPPAVAAAVADTNRVLSLRFDTGGKGINVARVLKALGHEALACGLAAGQRGRQIEEQLLASPRYHETAGVSLYQSVVEYLTSTGQL